MSLVPDYDDSLSSSESSDEDSPAQAARLPEVTTKLPKPDFIGNDQEAVKTSVFKNPFTEAENAKEAILQKHVKMVDAKDNVVDINGKKICWNYRKGRCRFGHNCKFAHDSDVQKSKDQLEEKRVQVTPQGSSEALEALRRERTTQKRKKRPGLSQGLVPSKKVMKNYAKQK